jgi:enhancing lycopene biosynthesis protein 2
MSVRVGVVLSGCGVFDGSEIHEAVSILVALDKRKAQIICMAPNVAQSDTINHTTKKPDSQNRRVLEEAARIARGNIRDMATVRAEEIDALVFPGGYGAVKNLSTFATDGASCKVNEQVERLLREMAKAKKPVGLACIAPVLAARVLGMAGLKPKVSIGTDKETADAIRDMKAEHCNTAETEICIDEQNRLVSTPCYMNNVGPWTVYQGADRMVEQILRMAGSR